MVPTPSAASNTIRARCANPPVSTVDALEAELAHEFGAHPLAPVLRSAPGLGPVLAARVLAELGDDPHGLPRSRASVRSPAPHQ